MTVLPPVAALGGSFSLTPSVQPDVSQDTVDARHRAFVNAWRDYAETVRDLEIQEGTGMQHVTWQQIATAILLLRSDPFF